MKKYLILSIFLSLNMILSCSDTDDFSMPDNSTTSTTTNPPDYEIQLTCNDKDSDIYVTPSLLDEMTMDKRGDIVRCYFEETLSIEQAVIRMVAARVADTTAITAVDIYKIAYRTNRKDNVFGIATAKIYIPQSLKYTPSPIIVANHGTAGLADKCAPSYNKYTIVALTLPLASHGFPVVAPDYAGLGNEGCQGYGDSKDIAYSVLDAARALRKVLPSYYLSDDTIILGHSQGGGATLSALSYDKEYGEGNISMVIPFAPGWVYSNDLEINIFKYPNLIPIDYSSFRNLFFIYAFAYNYLGEENALSLFEPSIRDKIKDLIENNCVYDVQSKLQTICSNYDELYDDNFTQSVVDCFPSSTNPCIEPGKTFYAYQTSLYKEINRPDVDILYIQGMKDILASPEKASCIIDTIKSSGNTITLWLFNEAEHQGIVEKIYWKCKRIYRS